MTAKKKVKRRVSAKSKLLKVYADIETANQLHLEFQTKLYKSGAAKVLLHDSAMVGSFIASARGKVEKALK